VSTCETLLLDAPLDRWRAARDEVHAEICAQAWSAEKQSFGQSYGDSALDAALLQMPLVGFLPIDDPRVTGTIAAIERELCESGLVARYDSSSGVDGLPGDEGKFLACSFWLAQCFAGQGRRADATTLFERLLALRNDVGLLAEEYDTKLARQVGNFPQAFSHIGLVTAAAALG
jgi:GH15 family glucan-1,4-alpha-glucosidase